MSGIIKETMPVAHLQVSRSGIVVPVSATVSYHKSFEVEEAWMSSIVLVKLVNQEWNVDPSI